MKQNETLRKARSKLLVVLLIAMPVLMALGRCPIGDFNSF